MNKTMRNLLIGLTLLLSYCDGLIVPQEVASIISVVYPNIPPIKKGKDSRLGFGFRLGEHADFQVLVELGPQKYTKPLGNGNNDDSGGSDTSKRMVNHSEINTVIKPTYKKSNKRIHNRTNAMDTKITNHNAQKPHIAENELSKLLFGPKDQYPIPTTSIINPPAMRQVQQLDSKQSEQPSAIAEQSIETRPSNSMEAHVLAAAKLKREQQIKSHLMDVSLDD